jgi:hypothetical protein
MDNMNILSTAVTLLSVIGAYAPVRLLSVLHVNEEMPWRSIFLRAEYTLDRALNDLDSAKSKARESKALADGSNHLASLAWKYTEDIGNL